MYIVLSIAFVCLAVSWPLLRRYTRIWIKRPITASESIIAGFIAWLFLFSLLAWFGGIVLVIVHTLSFYKFFDIAILFFVLILTGFLTNFIVQSKQELNIDDTVDFLKEAIQFRRSEQRRFDILTLLRQNQNRRNKNAVKDSVSNERRLLQADLDKEKDQETQLSLLRKGTSVDINELWHIQTQSHSLQTLYRKVQDVRIDPEKKRLSLNVDFAELNEEQLKDETTVLRLNRQVYEFFQSIKAEPWLKPYIPYFESYFLICRAKRKIQDGSEIFYPFMKVEALISEWHKLEGTYFNPRKLSEISSLVFNNGAQV
jgi:hypothetical protein